MLRSADDAAINRIYIMHVASNQPGAGTFEPVRYGTIVCFALILVGVTSSRSVVHLCGFVAFRRAQLLAKIVFVGIATTTKF